MRILVTGVGGSAASNFVDSLRISNLDFDFVGVDSSPWMLPLSSVTKKYLVPPARDDNYISYINSLITENGCQVIHAQPDSEVVKLSESRHELLARYFLPNHNSIILASDKELFAQAMRQGGVSVPITMEIESVDDLNDVCSEIFKHSSKLWVRARRGAGSRASLPVTTSEQARNWISWWISEKGMDWSDFQISEFLPGEEFALQTIWQDGILISAEARQRVKYLYGFLSPSGQSSTPAVAKTTTNPEVYKIGLKAIQVLDKSPHGVYCVDLKTDSNGYIKVTEINVGRFFTTSNFFSRAGINMPEMSMRAAVGEKLNPLPIASLGDDLYWLRMVDMGFKMVHRLEMERYGLLGNS